MSAGSTGQAEGPERILVGWDRYGDETWWGPEYFTGDQMVYVPEARLKEAEVQRDAAQARIAELEAEVAAIRADRPFVMGFNEGHETALRQAMEAVQDQIDLAKASSLYSPKDRDLANVIGGAVEAIRAIAALPPPAQGALPMTESRDAQGREGVEP